MAAGAAHACAVGRGGEQVELLRLTPLAGGGMLGEVAVGEDTPLGNFKLSAIAGGMCVPR